MRRFTALALGLLGFAFHGLAAAQSLAPTPTLTPTATPTLTQTLTQTLTPARNTAQTAVPGSSEGALPQSLTGAPGDAVRGRAIVSNRQLGLCLLCHTGPIPEERFQGNLAPDLAGAGKRWSVGQLRLRMVDARALNPQTIMPSYHRSDGLNRVAPVWAGATMLTAQQIEDVVAYLLTLRD